MSLPEEGTKEFVKPVKSSKPNILLFILLLIIISGVGFYAYLKNKNVDFKNISINDLIKNKFTLSHESSNNKKIGEVKYDPKERSVFKVYKGLIVRCSGDGIRAFNKLGEEQWFIPASLNNPVLKIAGSEMLIADLGGKDVYVISGKSVKWHKKVDKKIINADISESGHVSIVHEEKGYKGAVTVYSLQGTELFTRTFAENFAFMAKVSPSGKKVLINSIDHSGLKSGMVMEFTDMKGSPVSTKTTKEDTIFTFAAYATEDTLVCSGGSEVICFNKDGQVKWSKNFSSRSILGLAMCQKKYAVVAVGGEEKPGAFSGRKTDIIFINSNSEKSLSYAIDDEVVNIEAYDDLVAVNTGREIHIVNTKGKLLGKYISQREVTGVYFLSSDEIVLIDSDSATVIKVG